MDKSKLIQKINLKQAKICVIGLGYVGLPLVIEFAKVGFQVIGLDIDEQKVQKLTDGISYIKHIQSDKIKEILPRFTPTTDFSVLTTGDCIIICVPTPLNRHREPDMRYVFDTAKELSKYLQKNQLIVLESTTYPGTTDEDVRAILEGTGLKAGVDFYLAFSPEREDPGNAQYSTSKIPKVVGGYTEACLEVAKALYDQIVIKTVPVSSTKVAESVKLLENIYRAVNIALVNELKMLFDRIGIDIWEVIEAAKTKPFGFQAFYPGPGLGGHCIPIDPFYLTWKAREFDFSTRFIELAGEINIHMPYYVVEKTIRALGQKGKSIINSKILILGLAYKKDVDDARESPSLKLIELFEKSSAQVDYNDPYIPVMPKTRRFKFDKKSIPLTAENLLSYDCVVVATNHTDYDPHYIVNHSQMVVDTRGLTTGIKSDKIIKA